MTSSQLEDVKELFLLFETRSRSNPTLEQGPNLYRRSSAVVITVSRVPAIQDLASILVTWRLDSMSVRKLSLEDRLRARDPIEQGVILLEH